MNNAYATLLVSTYILTVVVKGNSLKLIDNLKHDKGFIKWAVALGLTNVVIDSINPKLSTPFSLLVYTAMILQVSRNNTLDKSLENFQNIFTNEEL